jgi:hypothetical protein
MQRGGEHGELMYLWGIQESLLQSYRSIFITAESIVFAVAAAIAAIAPQSALVLTLLGFSLLWLWHEITSNRARDVSFVQWLLAQVEHGEAVSTPLHTFKEFQAGAVITVGAKSVWRYKGKDPESKVNDHPFVNFGKSPSRKWMEVWLPSFFIVLWVVVAYLAISAMRAAAV